ncbi:hypothetical protein RISK_001591 [Rhodopirellula islandica]|uniref:Uncharacterized protein n=1 Tax=Rhodopirellula islandica TaxID=595434 RepID=A0A0J1BIM2_RHOIS|nr:hypothetical protein RISK_001591 [Rhodopirellula islandica]
MRYLKDHELSTPPLVAQIGLIAKKGKEIVATVEWIDTWEGSKC